MTTNVPQSPSVPAPENAGRDEFTQLRDTLKRCSPATIEAACQFRRTGNPSFLRPVIVGVIERYVERELRPKLKAADDHLRLIEDLGIDSLTMMEIVVLTEDVLHISVTNDELTGLRTLGDIRQFVAAKVAAPAGPSGIESVTATNLPAPAPSSAT